MTVNKPIVLSSDHAAIELRQLIATHIETLGWEAVDIGLNHINSEAIIGDKEPNAYESIRERRLRSK